MNSEELIDIFRQIESKFEIKGDDIQIVDGIKFSAKFAPYSGLTSLFSFDVDLSDPRCFYAKTHVGIYVNNIILSIKLQNYINHIEYSEIVLNNVKNYLNDNYGLSESKFIITLQYNYPDDAGFTGSIFLKE